MASAAPAPRWEREQLEASRRVAVERFRVARMKEPLEKYRAAYTRLSADVERLLVTLGDLVTQPDDAGAYVFPELPNGSYTLRVWHPDLGDRSMKVTVVDGVTDIDVNL